MLRAGAKGKPWAANCACCMQIRLGSNIWLADQRHTLALDMHETIAARAGHGLTGALAGAWYVVIHRLSYLGGLAVDAVNVTEDLHAVNAELSLEGIVGEAVRTPLSY